MKIVAISDTHNQHAKLDIPDGDVFIHAGDATVHGTKDELTKFFKWMNELPHKVKIFVPGNHDKKGFFNVLDQDMASPYPQDFSQISFLVHGMTMLGDFTVAGSAAMRLSKVNPIRYGFPISELKKSDILITHNAPYEILDECKILAEEGWVPKNIGDKEIRSFIEENPPKLHLFGHIHTQGGTSIKRESTTFMNLSACNDSGLLVRQCAVIESDDIFS